MGAKMAKGKSNSKALAQSKRHRRSWLTFMRMIRYGVNNFSRNAWLTIAATAVMTITLLIIFITVSAQKVLTDTAIDVGRRIDRSIYLKAGTTEDQAGAILSDLRALSNVESVTFISTEQGKADFAQSHKNDVGALNALNEATNQIPATIRISLKDANSTTQLVDFVKNNQALKTYIEPSRQPTFMSERKSATDTIASWTNIVRQIGIVASIVFTAISMLIVFNTIRMAIFNRRDEIEMMKLIGANKSFIRGPFVVEAMVYGFVAGLLAAVLGLVAFQFAGPGLASFGILVKPTVEIVTTYMPFVMIGMILLGSLVGAASSLLATRRYLKI